MTWITALKDGELLATLRSVRFACPPLAGRGDLLRVALIITTAAVLAIALAPTSAADTTANLKSAVDSTRAASGCPPLESDPVLNDVALRNTSETDTYLLHVSRDEPFESEERIPKRTTLLATILRDVGYNASKSKLLVGYGHVEADAISGALLQGWDSIPDCAYTKYGVSAIDNADPQQTVTAVVLAAA